MRQNGYKGLDIETREGVLSRIRDLKSQYEKPVPDDLQLATDAELLCQNIKAPSNTLFQLRKSSSSVYANIREANYGQSKADMLSKFEIALKECSETEGWLQLLFNTQAINEETFKSHRNLCGRIRRMLIASCKTLKENAK